MALPLLLLAAAAVAASVGEEPPQVRRRRKLKSWQRKLRVDFGGTATPLGDEPEIGELVVTRGDTWQCGRARTLTIPRPSDYVPGELLGGPIGMVMEAGTGIIQQVFDKLGRRCTVTGGQYRTIDVVQIDGPVKVIVVIEVAYVGHETAAKWRWVGTVSSTGALPLANGYPMFVATKEYGPNELPYLRDGGEPPGQLWPHFQMVPKWESSVPPELRQPIAEVQRTGDDLRLAVWLPPRAALSELHGAWKKRRVIADVEWTIRWSVQRP